MRFLTVSFSMAMLLLASFFPVNTMAAQQYVEITEPFVNVYEFLDPKSSVLSMVKKNDRLELIYAGTTWYQVKVGPKQGWVERKAGHVVNGPAFSPVFSIILVILLLAGTMLGVSFYLKKQKQA